MGVIMQAFYWDCPKLEEKELLERVSRKLGKSIPDTKGWIESVSHNKGLAY